jgi:hypothetical protein
MCGWRALTARMIPELPELKPSPRGRYGILLGSLIALVVILVLGGVSYRAYVHSVPPYRPRPPALPDPNGYDRALVTVANLRRAHKQPMTLGWPHRIPELLSGQLAPVRTYLNEVRATFRLEWQAPPRVGLAGAAAWDPDVSPGFRDCARWFVAESVLARHQGNAGLTLQRSLDASELASRLSGGSGMDLRLIANACHAIGFSQAEQITTAVPPADIPGALERVRRLRREWPPLSELVESERLIVMTAMTEAFQKNQEGLIVDTGPSPSVWEAFQFAWTPRRLVLARIERHYLQRIEESGKPVRQRADPPVPPDIGSRAATAMFASRLSDFWRWEKPKTELALLEVVLAVRMHRFTHGRYPVQLNEIDQRWLPSAPLDLWDQPIRYRLQASRPVIYSLGPDGVDDGGRAINPVHLTPGSRGDLVFGKLSSTRWPRVKSSSPGSPEVR